jgi:hypothetical protein
MYKIECISHGNSYCFTNGCYYIVDECGYLHCDDGGVYCNKQFNSIEDINNYFAENNMRFSLINR